MSIRGKSSSVLALVAAASISFMGNASAADVASTMASCNLSASGGMGYLMAEQGYEVSGEELGEKDYSAGFGDVGGLLNCGGFNLQADFAHYDHSIESAVLGDKDVSNSHFGGALFGRNEMGALGVSGSVVTTSGLLGTNGDRTRGGAFAEMYMSDMVTFGGSYHYFDGSDAAIATDHSGHEISAFLNIYPHEDLSLKLQGDFLDASWDGAGESILSEGGDLDIAGWGLGAELEYQLTDLGISAFAGGRYVEREFDDAFTTSDTQGYVGLRFALGGSSASLRDSHRSGPVNNTSTFLEKVPNDFMSLVAAEGGAGVIDEVICQLIPESCGP